MTKIIAHEYMKEQIYHDFAQRKIPGEGLEILSLSRLLNAEEAESERVLILKLAKRLRKDRDQYPAYEKMLSFPSFYEEVISFAKTLALWGIEADSLPAEDENEKQLREIVRTALSLDLKEKRTREKLEESISEILASGVKAADGFEKDYFHYTVMNRLKEAGMETVTYCDKTPASVSRKHALSTRMEIEGCAQHICQTGRTSIVVLASPGDQMPVLRQVFERYGIPYSYTGSAHSCAISKSFLALVQFAVNPSADSLTAAIDAQAFPEPCDEDLLDFLVQVLAGIEAPDSAEAYRAAYDKTRTGKFDPDRLLRRDPVTVYTGLETRAKEYFAKIQPCIDQLAAGGTPKEKLIASYNILTHSPLLENRYEIAAGRGILSELQDCADLIESDEEALFFARMVGGASVSAHKLVTDFCIVTDLTHPCLPKENTYVLGANGKSWPGFTPLSGIFDETYVRRIEGFPSLNARQEAYLEQLAWIERSCTGELIYSAAASDYQGRELVGAYELEKKCGESSRWDLDFFNDRRMSAHHLSRETAASLFLRKDEENNPYVSGSVSSVENWFKCPYRYFLSSGLYVRQPETPKLSADNVGTWQHAVMENAILDEEGRPDPDYAEKLTEEKIAELIHPYFEALAIANPNDTVRVQLSEKRMVSSLMKSADFLRKYEKGTTFAPEKSEHNFRRFAVSPHVRLNGTIDRISRDPGNHMLEIIDYKSSSKTLSPDKVSAGEQLQLLTYLIAAAETYETGGDLTPAGTYYFSLTSSNITNMKAASVNRRSYILTENDFRHDEEAMESAFVKSRQLSGWTFTDRTDAVDRDGKYVGGLSRTYIYEDVKLCLYTLYEYFYENLLGDNEEGEPAIAVSPSEDACQWCDYAGICRFHGEVRKAEKIYDGPLTPERKKSK